ncbi:hypothetical protein [Mucilaginibacter sp.]|uniref:hypothetical protein n=1 Tax=Mucilaginibacter sp. TaxID=1882438 RepID=UPI0031B59EDC
MALMVSIAVGSWEFYLRQKGVPITYDDGSELWADKRANVYEPTNKATVFIGTSRIKYDVDINTWRKITGKDAVQLGFEGSSPLTILEDLGNDTKFNGHLVVDATEELFFSVAPPFNSRPSDAIHYYQKETYAQKASFQLNHVLESHLVFLNEKDLSLNAELDKLHIPNRPGVMGEPEFPIDFEQIDFDRQDKMAQEFLTNTVEQKQVTDFWKVFLGLVGKGPQPKEKAMILQKAKNAVEKIRARGGDVVFVRMPSSGYFWQTEQRLFKRQQYWEPLITATNTRGIHFADYPTINHFECPEWSHLCQAQAVVFTTELIKLLPSSFAK